MLSYGGPESTQPVQRPTEPLPDMRIVILQSELEPPGAKEDAFASIVDEFGTQLSSSVTGIVGPFRAEDVVQDTFLNAWVAIGQGRFHSERENSLRNWLLTIAHNRALNEVRRDRYASEGRIADDLWDSPDSAVIANPSGHIGDPVAQLEFREDISLLHQVPTPQREALMLRVIGYSPREIATTQETSLAGAKGMLQRGRRAAERVLAESLEPMASVAT